jgi:hypothetical protein
MTTGIDYIESSRKKGVLPSTNVSGVRWSNTLNQRIEGGMAVVFPGSIASSVSALAKIAGATKAAANDTLPREPRIAA